MQKQQRFGIVLPIILFSYFMIILDNSIIFTSTAKIATDLGLNTQSLAWITNAYALTFGGFLLFAGKAGDIFGRKNFFILGLVIFSLSSLLVGLATSAPMIITMRAIQGIGSAILAPSTLALLMDNYTDGMRTRAIAYYGATGGLGASFGLVIGGLITTYASWRVGFFINVPIGLIMLLLAIKYLKRSKTYQQQLDFWGTLLSVIGVTALVYSIDGSRYRLVALVVAIATLSWFVAHERRASVPIMPLLLFKDAERSWAYLTRFFFVGVSLAYFFLTPLAMQQVYGFTPLQAALGFLPETVPQFIAALLVSRLTTRYRPAQIIAVGMGLIAIGSLMAALIKVQSGYWLAIALPMVVLGIGQGIALGMLTVAGVAHTNATLSGSASGVINAIHQIGGSIGLSAVVALTSQYTQPVQSYNWSLIWITVIAILGLIGAIGILKAAQGQPKAQSSNR
ncbi:MFS transporter [Lactiplantibacillus sp. WILCCON 0030]|uniref:MFS transporter n=1 Tax=Lactiplantibacillus brownii TaxID=3069269 RepID=A0ABU1AAH3_9LACO|nr:MFS transporter [Lactiplantibacillus brownii]MDQ7937964.1 MFS transporter [Lactiplantibacillus brownii]